jgi:hypothetical protein
MLHGMKRRVEAGNAFPMTHKDAVLSKEEKMGEKPR